MGTWDLCYDYQVLSLFAETEIMEEGTKLSIFSIEELSKWLPSSKRALYSLLFDQNRHSSAFSVPLKIKIRRMDTLYATCLTPEVRRLVTFHSTPIPNDRKLSFSNSPAKLARAGFQRSDGARKDEVFCEFCNITYGDWEGESPFAVHRVLNEHCPFLNSPSTEDAVQSHPRVQDARRRLFTPDDQNNDSGYDSRVEEPTELSASPGVSVLSPGASFSFPFVPKVGDGSMFASRRLKTYADSSCKLCRKWAEEGFVFKADTNDVQCVFCGVVCSFDSFDVRQIHVDSSALCPRVQMKDVGNISIADEERIKLKNLQWQLTRNGSQQSYAISHPQFEDQSARLGTYENWPYTSWDEQLHPAVLTDAGFYYTGCSDRVNCFSCGVGLYTWIQGSDPWTQHARHMPTCPHLQTRGQSFIQEAAQAEVLTDVQMPSSYASKDSSSSAGHMMTSPPGSLTMDVCAVTAALSTSQYSIADIRQAVLTYFFHTSRFPTKAILLGQLRAADVNFTDLCKQREANYQKDTQLQEKDTVIQQTYTQLQESHTQLQESHTQLQEKDTVVEQHVQTIQQRDEALMGKEAELQRKEAELQRREEELRDQRQELERKERVMAYQERQISSLTLQVTSLAVIGRQAARVPAVGGLNNAAAAACPPNSSSSLCDVRCKVCLSAESNTMFQPCHHITCCKTCAQQLVSEVCPVCRTPISSVLPAYIS